MSFTTSSARWAGAFSIVFGLLMFVPLAVLGAAINWPASLDQPGSVLMPLIQEQETAVRIGYLVYLAYSVLFFPTIALIARVLGDSTTTRLATTFAAISALARSIGILRWLTVLPALATTYAVSADPALPALFDAINTYGGGIGELLGVSLFAALAIGLLAVRIIRSRTLPRWIGWFGVVAVVALLIPWVEVFGVDPGALLTVSVTVVQLWFLAIGIVLVTRKGEPAAATSVTR
jgi:hypothetical protein